MNLRGIPDWSQTEPQVIAQEVSARATPCAVRAEPEGASASRCSLAFSLFARLLLGDLGGTISASRPIVFSSLSQAVYRKSPSMTYYIIQVFDIAFFVSYKFRPALSNTGNENTNGRLVLGA